MTTPPSTRSPHTTGADHVQGEAPAAGDEVLGVASTPVTPEGLADAIASRVVIEQAKGMLMFVYGIDAEDAFEILHWQSQEHNIKVRLIAQQILADLTELSVSKGPARHVCFDGLMFTAHQRVAAVATRYNNNHPTAT